MKSFTNDLAVALKVPHAEAERIKINHGCVLQESVNQSAHIAVKGIAGTRPVKLQLTNCKVLGARAEELFDIVKNIIADKDFDQDISGGIVLTGGGALIKSLPELVNTLSVNQLK